jgi:hypothetical protein
MSRSPCMREPRRARRLRVGVGLVAGCAMLAGCVSVRPLPLVPLAEVSRWMRLAVVDTVVEGGSTITQQYVKNTYVTGEQTLRRKLAEAAHAWGLERANAKAAILEAYLNTVYFGQGAYGVQAAAKAFSTRPTGSPCPRRRCWPG